MTNEKDLERKHKRKRKKDWVGKERKKDKMENKKNRMGKTKKDKMG